jgi:hypothetical protein
MTSIRVSLSTFLLHIPSVTGVSPVHLMERVESAVQAAAEQFFGKRTPLRATLSVLLRNAVEKYFQLPLTPQASGD